MGHWSGTAYDMRLNTEHPTYQDIVDNLEKEIKQKYIQNDLNPGESFSASMKFNLNNKEKISYCSSGYKNRVDNSLSNLLVRKIEENIKSDDNKYYYYISDSGENAGAIQRVHGYAKKVAQYLYDAGYTDYDQLAFYNERGVERFHECLNNKEELAQVIKEGEKARFKRELVWKGEHGHEINEYSLHVKKAPQSKEYILNEKWLAYWLVYGTEDKYDTSFNYYSNPRMNLKEYFYALDYKYYEKRTGTYSLQKLTCYGVSFTEGIDSIEANFKLGIRYDHSGHNITKEDIESWYQENKKPFSEVPKFSKETAYYIRDNYPETFIKFKAKLIELHNRHQEKLTVNNVAQTKKKI